MRVSHKKLLIAIIGVLVLLYGFWQARDFLRGPQITLISPKEGEELSENLIYIEGKAVDVTKFSINGRTIFIDEDGNFKEKMLLAKGVNYIEISVEDKFGHKKQINRTVLLK